MSERFTPLAVVGVSALFPGSADAHGFWRDIFAGRDLITDVPARRWLIEDHYDPDPQAPDKTYCKRGAFLDDVDFDPVEFGLPPNTLSATDTCQILALIVAKQVLDDALDSQFREIDRERASVILGVTSGQELFLEVASRLQAPVWIKALRESGIAEEKVREIRDRIASSYVPWQENTFPGLLGNVVAGRIANRFNLGGTNCVTDAACASSLSALSMAAYELQLGRSDLVITGGADTFNDISMFVCFSKTPALSPTGDCRPFSDRADGTILGEGLAMVALKRLEDAEQAGNRIYAVIRGIGSSSDGRSKSIYAPLSQGQERAMRRAYEAAGYNPATVQLVEAHGTGTAAGDAAEIESMTSVFGASSEGRSRWCALGSVKSQVGHTKAAAGAAGLFKTVMALHHKTLPPTIKVERPNAALLQETSPFYINTCARPWIRPASHPRRASLSSFGFGGTNFHVTLEEYGSGRRPEMFWTAPAELILACGDTPAALSSECRRLAEIDDGETLAEAALASQLSFDASAAHRIAIVCESTAELRRKLLAFAETGSPAPGVYAGAGNQRGRVAFLFPGQGSQHVGMTADVSIAFEEALAAWDAAPSLAGIVFPPPVFSGEESEKQSRRLMATEVAQPAIGVASAALLGILRALRVEPDCVAGHSFGEITALYAAGAIDFESMLAISHRRGELLSAAASEPGGMLSVRLDGPSMSRLLGEWGLDLALANHNSPRQSVLSGTRAAIEEAAQRCASAGIESSRLSVSTAFHSPLVAPAVDPFRAFLDECPLRTPKTAIYSNLDAAVSPQEAGPLRERLARQIAAPVRFAEMVDRMYEDGVRTFIEVGPGSVLTSLVHTILVNRRHHSVALDRPRTNGLVSLWHGLGELAALGLQLDWAALRARHKVEKMRPRAAGRLLVPINGGNYGRPYPPPGGAAALPPPVPAQPEIAAAPPSSDALAQAYKTFQESISDAHRNWQANLARGHESFLRSMESAYLATVSPSGVQAPAPPPLPAVERMPALPPPPAASMPEPQTILAPEAPGDLRELLWSVVAEATGYPAEMLEPRMSLESDLGIDSIKRVEIFSALQQRLPALPEMDQGRIGELPTLAEILGYLEGGSPAPAIDLSAIVLRQVAESTGYPVEMLHGEMSLESDLGIDSIKRVEIFSALQQALPGRSEFDTAALGELQTIAQITAYLGRSGGEPSGPPMPVSRLVVQETIVPPAGHRTIDLTDGPAVILGGGDFAGSLAELLVERGFDARVVDAIPDDAGVVISLIGLQKDVASDIPLALLRTAQAVASRFASGGGVFVMVGEHGSPSTPSAAGLAKTAAWEWPSATVRSLAIETDGLSPRKAAAAIAKELLSGGPEPEVTLWPDGRRATPLDVPGLAAGGTCEMGPSSVIAVSGGARGITADCIIALAHRTRCRFLLLGRSNADAPEVRQTLKRLSEAGAEGRYAQLDIRDGDAVTQAFEDARRDWGPITGIVHGAGVLADRRIENISPDDFQRVFSTKVEGLRSLIGASGGDPLKLLCVFSSVAARFGNAGQAAYAMANEATARMAYAEAARRGDQTKVKVIDWGPWEGGMVTPALARRFAAQGVTLLGLQEGTAAFVEELFEGPASQIEVLRGGVPPARVRELRVRIDRRSHPFLADHQIQDVPVLPAVEALELLLRCAIAQENAGSRFVCRDLKVLRGVRLDAFDRDGNLLFVRPRGNGVFELTSPDGARHYEATLIAETDGEEAESAYADAEPAGECPWSADELYGKLLFHGPAFQVIQDVEGVSESGILGTIAAAAGLNWRDGYRRSDAAMLDGGLQLARLWGFHSLGKLTLPARIGRIVTPPAIGDRGPVHCRVTGRTAGKNKIVCDLDFTSQSGVLVARMNEVEMYAAPSE